MLGLIIFCFKWSKAYWIKNLMAKEGMGQVINSCELGKFVACIATNSGQNGLRYGLRNTNEHCHKLSYLFRKSGFASIGVTV